MLYLPMNFGEITIDDLIDTSALSSVISEGDCEKNQWLSLQTILDATPDFQIMVANGRLETPKATVEIQFDVGDILFEECFIVMINLTSALVGLFFLQGNSSILGIRQGKLNFALLSMQLQHADNNYSNINEPLFKLTDILIKRGKQTVVSQKPQIYERK